MKRWIVVTVSAMLAMMVLGTGQVIAQQAEPAQPNVNVGAAPASAADIALGGVDYWAVVSSTGDTARSRGGESSTRLARGTYEVIFRDDIRQCAYTGTIGSTGFGGPPAPGQITVSGRANDVRGVFVQIYNANGVTADRPFHLLVSC